MRELFFFLELKPSPPQRHKSHTEISTYFHSQTACIRWSIHLPFIQEVSQLGKIALTLER